MVQGKNKDSGIKWIGRIPNEWKTTAIKRLMYLYAGATPKSDQEELWDGDIAWITPADYKTEDVFVSKGRRNITDKGMMSCATTLLPKNSIIFSKRAPIGSVVLNREPLCTNQGCIGCIPKENVAFSKYYYYSLSAFTEQFEIFGAGTTFKEISANNFANFILPFPEKDEQQRIADYLDKKCSEIDALVDLQEQMIAQLTDYKQSVITEAVTKGLNPYAELVPSGIDWIGDVPKGWKTTKISNLAKTNSGSTPKCIINDSNSKIIWVRTVDINEDEVFTSSNKLTENEFINASCPMLEPGTCVVAMYGGAGTIGKSGILKVKATINQALCSIETRSNCFNYYLFYVLRALRPHWMKYAVGTRKDPNINQEIVKRMSIPLPPLSEQQAIASYLDSKCSEIDSLIALKRQKTETLKEYKKSVIYEAVTGKTIID